MSGGTKTVFKHYGGALLVTALAVGLRLLLDPWLGEGLPFLTLFASVVVAAWLGGRGPAMLALVAGTFAAAYFFLKPRYSIAIDQPEDRFGLVLYFLVGLASVVFFESLRKARKLAEHKQRQLEEEVAARRTAENVLAEREKLLRITLTSIGDAVLTTDASGHVTFLNALAQKLTGWTQDEAGGKPLGEVFRIVHEDGRQAIGNPLQKVLWEGRGVGLTNHTLLISKDGRRRPIENRAAPIQINDSCSKGIVLIFRDVTERLKAEENLRASEAKYRMLFENMAEEVHYWQVVRGDGGEISTWRLVDANPPTLKTWGKSLDQIRGKTADEIFGPGSTDHYLPVVRKVMTEGAPHSFEDYFPNLDRHFRFTAVPLGDCFITTGADITAIKKSNGALREAEERFRLAADAINGIIYEYDLRTGHVERTRGLFEVLGYRPEEAPPTAAWWWDRIHAADHQAIHQEFEQAAQRGNTVVTQYRVRHKDGRWLHVEDRAVLVTGDEGRPIKMVGCTVDVTARIEAEQSLRASEEQFRTLVNNCPDLIARFDTELRHLFISPAIERLIGLRPDELIGKTIEEVGNPKEICRQFAEKCREAALTRVPVTFEFSDDRTGSLKYLIMKIVPEAGTDGSVNSFLIITSDVTERQQTEKELRAAEQRWRTMAEALPNLVWTDLPDGQCDWLSSQWGNYTGIRENELLGLQWVEKVLHPDDRARTLACWLAACADEGDYDIEYRIRRHDGEYRWFKTRGVPMRNERGKIVYWFGTCTDIEDNKRLEEALRRQQAVLTMAEAAARIGHFEWDIPNDESRWSPELEALFGLQPGEFEGGIASWRKMVHPEDLAGSEVAVQESLSTGRLQTEFRVIWPDGAVRWLEARAVVSKEEDGSPVRMVGIHMDVTDRKRIEEEERSREKRLRMALAAARMVAWEYDPATSAVLTSDNAAEVFGLPPGEMIEDVEQGFALVHRDDVERHRAKIMKAYEERGTYLSHYRMVRPDNGSVIWLEERGHAVSDGSPRTVRLVGVVMDVTARKQQEIRLMESEERLSAVIEAIPQVVWTARTNGEVDFASRRWYDYTGRTPEETLGVAWATALHPDDRAQTADKWQAALATSEPTEIEYRLRAADGRYRWQLIRGVPLKNSWGQVVKWFGTITDIHDRKQAEQQLQENDRRKDEFLATLAHELRNPLAPLRNGLQVMRMANGKSDAIEAARTMMERQLTQMVRLVDDLMDVSRISSGKLELRKERVSLLAVMNSAIETSRPLIEQMGHKLTVELPRESLVVEADLTRLAQAFLNLLNNAAKYSEEGGQIWFTAEGQGSDVVVSVKDEGIGIAGDQLPRIFEMFSQVNCSLGKAQGGLGIGLTLVKRLVEMHDGRIEARSDGPGMGSEFIVRLPVVVEASIPRQEDAGTEGEKKSRLRILVVDDNRDGADSLSMMLKMMGNDTQTAYDGEEAVVLALQYRPHVILLDIGLPKLTGYQACRCIRQQPGGKEFIIIAQTGWGQEQDRKRTREAGFDHHMVKPVDPQALMRLLAGLQTAQS